MSAFHPVISKCSVETESSTTVSLEENGGEKKISPPRVLGSKLLSGIKGALSRGSHRRSGRENPVSLLAEGEEEEEEGEMSAPLEMSRRSFRANSDNYSDSDIDEDIMEPIVGQYHLLDEESCRPPSAELGSVEVIAESTSSGLIHVLEREERPSSLESIELRPPSVVHPIMEDIPETSSPVYHPLLDQEEEDTHANEELSIRFPRLAYKSPKAQSSPDNSNKSSNSPHSRTTASGNSADYEVRETNRRRSSQIRIDGEEVVVDLDGNATVHSGSTSSSNYHVHSPKIREGAMPGERFFAATPSVDAEELDICSLSLSPNKSGKRDIMEQLMQRFPPPTGSSHHLPHRAHSPHTVSSASISNTSSSGSETKKPLKFVAIKKGEGGPKRTVGMIKPRISKEEGQRPPIQTFTSYQKPPQSPRKDVQRGSGARTPTRTPPPGREYGVGGGATTPSSPPVIIDGPNVMRGDLKIATKPTGRRSSGGILLHPPSSELFGLEAVRGVGSDKVAIMVEGANDGAQEVTASFVPGYSIQPTRSMLVTPERCGQKWTGPQLQVDHVKNAQQCKDQNVAMISPDRQE
jgi:hypothetical protein